MVICNNATDDKRTEKQNQEFSGRLGEQFRVLVHFILILGYFTCLRRYGGLAVYGDRITHGEQGFT